MKRTETIRVAVVNHSTAITDHDAAAGVVAMQKQIDEDFGPVWNVDARLRFVGKDGLRGSLPDHWGLVLVDDPSQGEQLGYHEVTTAGLPLSTIVVSRIPQGHDWTHTASHELMEMLADPGADLAVYSRPDETTHRIYAHEVCDPVAAYEDGYAVRGRQVSNFVHPGWFHSASGPAADANGRFDERGLIGAPLELRPGGYIGVLDPTTLTWSILRGGGGGGGDAAAGAGAAAEGLAAPDADAAPPADATPAPATAGTSASASDATDPRLVLRATSRSTWQLSDMDWIP